MGPYGQELKGEGFEKKLLALLTNKVEQKKS